MPAFQLLLEGGAEPFHADVFFRAHLDGFRVVLQQLGTARLVADFGLVEHANAGRFLADDVLERLVRNFQVLAVVGSAPVHDFQDAVGMGGHSERALERLDEVVGELADEPDGVGEDDVFSVEV